LNPYQEYLKTQTEQIDRSKEREFYNEIEETE